MRIARGFWRIGLAMSVPLSIAGTLCIAWAVMSYFSSPAPTSQTAATLSEFRQNYPAYNDMSDADLASALHRKFYSDMPRGMFDHLVSKNAPQPKHGEELFTFGLILIGFAALWQAACWALGWIVRGFVE